MVRLRNIYRDNNEKHSTLKRAWVRLSFIKEEKPAGSYEVDFNSSSLTSGVYLYRMKVGSFIQKKKKSQLIK